MGSHQLLASAEKCESSSAETEVWVRVWVAVWRGVVEVRVRVNWASGREGFARRCAIVCIWMLRIMDGWTDGWMGRWLVEMETGVVVSNLIG